MSEDYNTMIRRTCQRKPCLLKRHKAGIVDGAFLFAYTWTEEGILIDVNCPECGAIHCVELGRPEPKTGKEDPRFLEPDPCLVSYMQEESDGE